MRLKLEEKARHQPGQDPRGGVVRQRYANWRVLDTLAATFATRAPKKATVMRAKKAVNMFGSVEWR